MNGMIINDNGWNENNCTIDKEGLQAWTNMMRNYATKERDYIEERKHGKSYWKCELKTLSN